MIFWTIKLIKSLKTAIAGRKYPHQLAAAVAFGALLGVVPHGNLLALAILIVVLSLRLNHAMAGLTAVGVSFAAAKLDQYSHEVGSFILTNPSWAETASKAWQLPLVPWTDLNNTIVMGSFVIGVAAVLPIFMLTYPVFRLFAPTKAEETERETTEIQQQNRNVAKHSVVLVDQSHQEVSSPHVPARRVANSTSPKPAADATSATQQPSASDTPAVRISQGTTGHDSSNTQPADDPTQAVTPIHRVDPPADQPVIQPIDQTGETLPAVATDDTHLSVETRIDVIRMKDVSDESIPVAQAPLEQPVAADAPPPPMDEALNYLLRQLRDSQQQRKAA
ncbi:MAG: TIGR03546 family protein [Pirellulaceae bacterium]|nr:TIGR03546 family protein [Pirellulaceae bacterium]